MATLDPVKIKTKRLLLRQWREEDKSIFASINSDPEVMEYYPKVLNTTESNEMAHKLETLISQKGWGFWAVEKIKNKQFIGFVGLHEPTYDLPVTPCVEIGWRIGKKHWGHGYATEAATAALDFAFNSLDLEQVYSFTSVTNKRSWSVMKRLGMVNTNQNFNHPLITEDSPLKEHYLYRITRSQWLKKHNKL